MIYFDTLLKQLIRTELYLIQYKCHAEKKIKNKQRFTQLNWTNQRI